MKAESFYQKVCKENLENGHLDTLALLVEMRTGKPLGITRRKRLARRLDELGLPRVTDLLVNLEPKEVEAWLSRRGRLGNRTSEEQT